MYVREILQADTRGVLDHLRYHLSSPIKISQRIESFIVNSTRSFSNLSLTFYLLVYVLYYTYTILYCTVLYCTIQSIHCLQIESTYCGLQSNMPAEVAEDRSRFQTTKTTFGFNLAWTPLLEVFPIYLDLKQYFVLITTR